MLEPRLYRVALLPVLFAAVIVMFSVVSRPPALRSETATDSFSGGRAAALAQQLLALAPERAPGSEDDREAAEFVASAFDEIEGGEVSEQAFGASFEGEDVELRNISLLLPGETDDRLLILAGRDCAEGECAVSSAAATGALLELARALGDVQHAKTILFVSTDGSTAGASGARELAKTLDAEPVQAGIVLSAPGAANPSGPFVVPWSTGPQSGSIQLSESAEAAVRAELGVSGEVPRSTLGSLLRLAVPAGLGEQSVLISSGVDAIALSSAGDLPLAPTDDVAANFSAETLRDMGRAILSLTLALDESEEALEHGPEAYVPLAGKLIPDWALALLALALLAPLGVAALDGLLRGRRHGEAVGRSIAWVVTRSAPFVAALVAAYILGVAGLVPTPAFPYQPGLHDPGVGGVIGAVLVAAAGATALYGLRMIGVARATPALAGSAVGAVAFGSGLALWAVNPFAALLLTPALHLCLYAAASQRGRAFSIAALVAGVVPAIVAVAYLGGELGVGALAPWHLLMLVAEGHFGPATILPLCLIAGCFLTASQAALAGPRDADPENPLDAYARTRPT